MLFNYHTHTKRCNHAEGEEREYIENAIKKGIKTLGFSDHAPYLFPKEANHYSGFRMRVDEMEDYVETVRALAKEYQSDIRILCGVELEYYPDYHQEEMEFLRSFSIDYCLLGQHILGNELFIQTPRTGGDLALSYYVTQVLAGIATGDFLYIAHPDIAGYQFSGEAIEREYRRLCLGAKRKKIPLEINLLGIREKRHYPDERFFKIAAEVGNQVVLGLDSHSPNSILDEKKSEEQALSMVEKLGLNLVKEPLL